MKTLISLVMFLMLAGCGDGSDCVNDNGPQAGQCKHYPNKHFSSCVQVSPYHHSCTLEHLAITDRSLFVTTQRTKYHTP